MSKIIKATDIPFIGDGKKYTDLGRAADSDTFGASESGKAIWLRSTNPASDKIFWFPLSILKRVEDDNPAFRAYLAVPNWFMAKEHLYNHF